MSTFHRYGHLVEVGGTSGTQRVDGGSTGGTLTARYISSSQLAGGAAPVLASRRITSRLRRSGPTAPVLPVPPPVPPPLGRTTAHSSPIHVRGGVRPDMRQARRSAGTAGRGREARRPAEAEMASEASCWGSDGGLDRAGGEDDRGSEGVPPRSLPRMPRAVLALMMRPLLSPLPAGCCAEPCGRQGCRVLSYRGHA